MFCRALSIQKYEVFSETALPHAAYCYVYDVLVGIILISSVCRLRRLLFIKFYFRCPFRIVQRLVMTACGLRGWRMRYAAS